MTEANDIGGSPPADRNADPNGPVPLPELRDALSAAKIGAVYQPIVRLADAAPIGLEALARLSHPRRGALAPRLFVPQIEAAGLAWPLTESVGNAAFGDWSGGRLESLGLTLALNFPLDVLLRPAALHWLDRARNVAGIPAARIVIELTESRPVGDLPELARAVARLRREGYGLAIDDVGPGQRDHPDLLGLEFSALKLDRHVVRRAMTSPDAEAFVHRTTQAAHAAGMRVIAEGIASLARFRRMAGLSVDEGQGFWFARPMAAESVAKWDARWRAATQTVGIQGPVTS